MPVRNPPEPWPPRVPGLDAIYDAINAGDLVLAASLANLMLLIDAVDDLPSAFSKTIVKAALKTMGEGRIEHAMHMLSQTKP